MIAREMESGLKDLVAAADSSAQKPWATVSLWILTVAAGTAQLLHPALLDQFRRDLAAQSAGQ